MEVKSNSVPEKLRNHIAKNSHLKEIVLGFLAPIENMEEEIKTLHEKTAKNVLEIERLKRNVVDTNSENGVEISTRQELHNFIN